MNKNNYVLCDLLFLLVCLLASAFVSTRLANNWGTNIRHYQPYKILPQLTEGRTMSDLNPSVNLNQCIYNYSICKSIRFRELEQELDRQLKFIADNAKTSLIIARDCYVWLTIASFMLCITVITVGNCTFLIAKKGWDDSPSYLQRILVVNLTISTLITYSISAYKYDENRKANFRVYEAYIDLENYNYACKAIGKLVDEEKTQESNTPQIPLPTIEDELEKLVTFNTRVLKEYNVINIDINIDAIPKFSDVQKDIQKSLGSSNN